MTIQTLKTGILLAVLSALLVMCGSLLGGVVGLQVALVLALTMNLIAYLWSDVIVLSMYRAHPLDERAHASIFAMVGDIAKTMYIPMPRLWMIDSSMANAFATGRNPQHASVVLTSGIMQLLSPQELRGVLAHELAHVKNRDILISTVAATLATAIAYVANMLQYRALYASGRERKEGNFVGALVAALVLPFAATLLQLALSRSREFAADETGSRATGDPLALASALEKLHTHVHVSDGCGAQEHAGMSALFIVHPFSGDELKALFSTHPPVHKRIEYLHRLARTMATSR